MANKRSIASVARRALAQDEKLRKKEEAARSKATRDSFVNFSQKLGVGADNPLTTASYNFNPITRIRTMLEWIHRGSWLGGVAVDLVAEDMTRAGVELTGSLEPEQMQRIEEAATTLKVWKSLDETIKWSRLYGGAIGYLMIEGQRPETPLRIETIGKGQFRGILVLDRWMADPSINDLVTELGPDIGLPKFYNVVQDSPAIPNMKIHHSRVVRLIGIELPYWQRVQENLWGISVLERLYDRMIAFDSATTGAAQLVYKAWIRTYKIDGLREIIASGGPAMEGLIKFVDMMRRFQGVEGITLLDGKDTMEAMQHSAFSGLSDALLQFGQQLAGALQIPLVRLFGQSPAGLNATGESDLRLYYDGINQQQNKDLKVPVTKIYRCIAQSEGIRLPEGFGIKFKNLWQLTDKEKAEIAESIERAVGSAEDKGLISQKTAMQELKQSSSITGIFSNITQEDIDAAEESLPPAGEHALGAIGGQAIGPDGTDKDEAGAEAAKKAGAEKSRDSLGSVIGLKRHHDLDAVVESAKGSIRRGEGWEVVMPADYGYIRRTRGADGEQVDCFIGPNTASADVFVIDQLELKTGQPDEHKVMLGYDSLNAAIADYVSGFNDGHGWARIGRVQRMGMDEFKEWLAANGAPDMYAAAAQDAAAHPYPDPKQEAARQEELARLAHKAFINASSQGNGKLAQHFAEQMKRHRAKAEELKGS